MKTYAHVNPQGEIVGIGMIYYEDGSFVDERLIGLVRDFGLDGGILRYGDMVRPYVTMNDKKVPDPNITAVLVDTDAMPGGNGLSYDRTFIRAFKHSEGLAVEVDMTKAKELLHEKRRKARAFEFAPLDIEATIPAKATEAETKRQAIRDKYAAIQSDIDACDTPDQLKLLLSEHGL